MSLKIRTRVGCTESFVLACDPSVVAANSASIDGVVPLAVYRVTGDEEHLASVPDDATRITVRVLREREMNAAIDRAGRCPERGRAVFLRAAADVENAVMQGDASGRSNADVLDSMSDENFALYQRFEAWLRRRHIEFARAGLVAISDWPDLVVGDDGFPVEALVDRIDECRLKPSVVLAEIADRVVGVGALGKARSPSSSTPSGDTTTGPTPGLASEEGGLATGSESTALHSGGSSPPSQTECAR